VDSGWVAAVATLVTALIVAATAVAAFRQLRHNRNANDMAVYFRLIDLMTSPEMLSARQSLARVAERFRTDPGYRARLRDPDFLPEEFTTVGPLLRSLEHISVIVTKGGIAEDLVLAEYADAFVTIWEQMRGAIEQRRYAFGPHTGRAFEHLAMRSKRYIDSGRMAAEYDALERDPQVPRHPVESDGVAASASA